MRFNILFISLFLFSVAAEAQICVGTQGQVQWKCWQNLYSTDMGELYAKEAYPLDPDYQFTLYKLQTPMNFDNQIGGLIAGFISVPVSDTVTFNITGDDYTRFYLSSDDNPDNITLEAYADGHTSVTEHDKYPEQTSAPIYLESGIYYYFEMRYVEGGGADHMSLYWKTNNEDPDNWTLINNNYIYDIDCLPTDCPERGTACDDGDPTTTDDQEDGFCNCVGKKDTANDCIGERAVVKSYRYDSIPGSDLNDLYADPDFPAMPNRGVTLHQLAEKQQNEADSTGTLIQSFLSVPVTGNYKFNITGNNECIFFISSDEDPANKQTHQILVTGSTDPTEHDKYIYQSTSNILLEKGKYYYIELNHKEGSWTEHFSIFWQTPFTQANTWKRIPEFYLYDYSCTLACIPQGTPCDDGDPYTNNDEYDANCECVGTPCSGPDCNDPVASYDPYPDCSLTDQIDNRADNNWLSCSTSANPNSSRASSHWVQYNFGQKYVLYQSQVWNYNEQNNPEYGFETVAIDYSMDGTNWTELGTYNWNLADGSADYSGFMGPDFGGVEAQYVLITCLDPDGSQPCRGFGKIVINAEYCPNVGESCDDGDPNTLYDTVNEFCICEGVNNLFNDCLTDTLTLGDTLIVLDTLSAVNLLESTSTISGSGNVMFVSGEQIDLKPGFETLMGSNFEAFIEVCNNGSNADDNEEETEITKSKDVSNILMVRPLPDTDIQYVDFYLKSPGHVKLTVTDLSGKTSYMLLDHELINKGRYRKILRTKKLNGAVYNVHYQTSDYDEVEKLFIQN